MVKDKKTTMELVDKFDKLCEKYAYEDIDVELLKREIKNTINNWSG